MAENTRDATFRRAIETCIDPDEASVGALDGLFADDVTVWSPNMLATGLDELARILAYRSGTFSDVDIAIDALDIAGKKGFAEFRVSATFSGPFPVDDEVTIEPNGKRLLLGAAAAAEFDRNQITALRAYFDDATLLEQMLEE